MPCRWALCALALCFAAFAEEPAPSELSAGDKEKVTAQIAQLGSEDFDARTKAAAELAKWDARIEPLLRAALEKTEDLETAGRLKSLLSKQETRVAVRKLAASYNNDPQRMMSESRGMLGKNEKASRDSQTLMRLAAAIFKIRAKQDGDASQRQRLETMSQMCERLATFSAQSKNLPPEVDDKEIRRAADDYAAQLQSAEEKK
jgi:hypothetical protein